MSRYEILSADQLRAALAGLPDWHLLAGEIVAEFTLPDFRTAIGLIVQIAFVAETLDHHPEIKNSYNKIGLKLCTHDAGNRITNLDIKMAQRISALCPKENS